jgi:hypothetical protein
VGLETEFLILGWGLLGAIAIIALTANRPAERSDKHKAGSGQPVQPLREDDPHRPSPDFAALINAIRYEGSFNRDTERRWDKGRRFRECANIFILVVTAAILAWTCWAIVQQVGEMRKVYPQIATQTNISQQTARSYLFVQYVNFNTLDPTEQSVFSSIYKWTHDENASFLFQKFSVINYGRVPAVVKDIKCKFVISEKTPDLDTINRLRADPFSNVSEWESTREADVFGASTEPHQFDCGPAVEGVWQPRETSQWRMEQLHKGDVWMIGVVSYANIVSAEEYTSYFCFSYQKIVGFTGVMDRGPTSCDKRT